MTFELYTLGCKEKTSSNWLMKPRNLSRLPTNFSGSLTFGTWPVEAVVLIEIIWTENCSKTMAQYI